VARLDKLSDQGLNSLLNAFSPPAPTELKAVGGDSSATLSWVSPVTLSQLPVTDHQVQYSADGLEWINFYDQAGGTPTAVVTGLTNASSYFFRVRAVNKAGVGPYASTTVAALIGLPPGAPTSLTATAGERQVQLSWVAPASTGGVAISDYTIEQSVDSGVTWTAVTRPSDSTALSFTVTGLSGQVTYQFRVRAVNGIGPGAWSSTATATPVSYDDNWADVALLLKMDGSGTTFVDSSVNNTVITSIGATQSTTQKKWGTKSADLPTSINYLTVANGPSTALTGAFTIEFWVFFKTAPARELYLFHGANNSTEGRNMAFLVTASNGQGLRYGRSFTGYLSLASPATFQASRWYHIAVVREADFRIRLFVDGVQINRETPLDVWNVSSSLSGRLFVGYPSRSPVAFIDEFRITKRARYSANFTPPTEPFPVAKRPLAPDAPVTVTLTAGNGQLSATWAAVTGAHSYLVEYQQDGGEWQTSGIVSTASRTITGLANGETYTVRVAAVGDGGQGVWITSTPLTLLTPPAQVSGLIAAAGHLQACLSWSAPDGDVTDYMVQYNNGSGWQTFSHPVSTNTFITVTGLTNGVSYDFRVAATSGQYTGVYSSVATATPSLALPEAPTSVTGVSGNGQATLSWTAPANTSCRVLTNYIVSYSSNSGSTWTDLSPQAASGVTSTVGGLTNGTSYIFRVAYQSSSGTGPWSASSAAVTPSGPPSPPASVSGTAGDGEVVVSWVAGSTGGTPVLDYLLQYSTDQSSWTPIDDGQNTSGSYTVTGLTNGTAYYFRVSARTAVGDSTPTQSSAVTPRGVPSSPGAPSGTATSGQVALTWTASSANGSAITGYTVEYTASGGSPQTAETGSANSSYTVTGLTNEVSYTFRVRATNAVGVGQWSDASSPVLVQGLPGVPTNFSGTSDDGGVYLSWSAPADDGGPEITSYTVEYTPAGGSAQTVTASSSPYTLTGLTNGTSYSIRVAANNPVGRGGYTAAITRTPATTPGLPTGLTATGGGVSGRLALAWTPPTSNGGSAITGYTVEYTPAGGSAQTVNTGSVSASYNLTGLTNGTLYSVRVRAVNVVGAGGYSTAATGTPGLVPGTPTSLSGTIGDGSVDLSWTAPASDGGATITSYTVEYTPAGGSAVTVTAAASPYTLTGLTNGTSYSIRVAANNAVGRGEYTTAIARTPQIAVPGAPTGLTATGGSESGRLVLDWIAPSVAGGSAITGYTVEYTPSGGSPQTVDTGSTNTVYNLDGLTNGTSYSVRVRAVNSGGAGNYSDAASGTPLTVPGMPTGFQGEIGDGSVALSWTAPSSTGGSAITNYTVEYTAAGGSAVTVTAASSPYTLTGLANGTSYSIRVAANNAIGRGSYTTAITRTPAFPPGTPTGLTATGGSASGRLVLNWTAPSSDGGSPITSYTVAYKASGSTQTFQIGTGGTATTYTLNGLTDGTSYTVQVLASNVVGSSSYSEAAEGTPFFTPGVPTALSGTIGNGSVALSWTAPTSNGGSAITNYTVEYTPAGGSAVTVTAASSPYTLTGLTNGTSYSIRVAANNAAGRGPYTTAITRTPATTPGTPTGLTATGGSSSGRLVLNWTAPGTNGGSAITGYTVEYTPSGGSAVVVNTGSTTASFNLDGLTNGTSYSVRVRAVNAVGAGSYSTAATGTPFTVPGVPTSLDGTIENGSVALSWTAPSSTGGSAITNYTVEYTPSGGSAVTVTASSSPYTLTGLTNGTSYSIRVAANNLAGRGAYATAITRTPATTPSSPTGLNAAGGDAQVALSWTAPSNNGGAAITGYRITYSGTTINTGSTSTSYTVAGLNNGTAYSFTVAATNAVGTGPDSSSAVAAPAGLPSAPTGLSGVAGDTQVSLSWTAPSNNGGAAITGYIVERTPSGGSASTADTASASTSYTSTGIANSVSYSFRVAAVNSSGTGPFSTPIAVMSFSGFARRTRDIGTTIGVLPQPGTWSSTSSSFSYINNFVPGFNGSVPTLFFTLSGNSGAITRSQYAANEFWSPEQYGGGVLYQGFYYYTNPSSLNAGTYRVKPPADYSTSLYPSAFTATYTFENPVLSAFSVIYQPILTSGTVLGEVANFTPAASVSVSGSVTTFKTFCNANAGKVFFTVPAGGARSVTFSHTDQSQSFWDLTAGPLRSSVSYGNADWFLDKFGTYSAPGPYSTSAKTLTLNPGNYWIDIKQSGNIYGIGEGYRGTITIT
jgi:hypothetical protein